MSENADENDAGLFGRPMKVGGFGAACDRERRGLVLSKADICDPTLQYFRVSEPHNRNNPRGICLLINQRDFDREKTGQERRDGTDVDADAIERTFVKLGYSVNRATNLTLRKMQMLLSNVSCQDHSHFDSFVCVVLSHGSDGIIYASDGYLPADNLISFFRGDRCPSLVGKPKMFFIQACRGSAFDRGVCLASDAGADDVLVCKLPAEADILVANSTVPGYFAWRNSNTGSWFIQELCTVLSADAASSSEHFDILTLLAVVSRKVALLYESNTGQPGSHGMKQMVSVSSTLTRRAFLTG
uniref:Caspase-3 n=1 Tax=Schistocephalus solidus TaxID=70667 RepID=A0A0X3Q1V8_SCHSO